MSATTVVLALTLFVTQSGASVAASIMLLMAGSLRRRERGRGSTLVTVGVSAALLAVTAMSLSSVWLVLDPPAYWWATSAVALLGGLMIIATCAVSIGAQRSHPQPRIYLRIGPCIALQNEGVAGSNPDEIPSR